ncbi:DUF7149 domain-containing protein [Pontibacter liquoris]|uniref:DUF7149 domain-containing protein n=1 Tax=Pontibacter liquoris TaxID=2905677 RepID=UPI003F5A85AE
MRKEVKQNRLTPRKYLSKAFLDLKTDRASMEQFKSALQTLWDSINLNETEEHANNYLCCFIKCNYYDKYRQIQKA